MRALVLHVPYTLVGHSTPFLLILGRVGGISDQKIETLIKSGNKDAIISEAIAAGGQARR